MPPITTVPVVDRLAGIEQPRGRRLGLRRDPRRHRHDAARPRAAADLARADHRVAAAGRSRERGARRLGVERSTRCGPARATRRQAALRVSVELLGLVPVFGRSPLQALARLHALAAAGVRARRRASAGRATPRRPPGSGPSPGSWRADRPGADDRRAAARRAG